MKELQHIQKKLEQQARGLEWSRDVKTWEWKRLILKKSEIKTYPLQELIKSIRNYKELETQGVKIQKLSDCSKTVQQKATAAISTRAFTNKFSVLQHARAKQWFVIQIPAQKNVHISFRNDLFQYWAGLFVVAGNNSQVTIQDDHQPSSMHFGAAQVYVLAGKDARVEHLLTGINVPSYAYDYEAVLEQGSQVSFVALHELTAPYYHHVIRHTHKQSGTSGKTTVLYDCKKSSQSWLFLEQDHVQKNTVGDMVVRALGRDRAKSKIDGWISIGKKGSDTNSYLQEDVLLLSEQAQIKAEPNLEIVNNEVSASHGATLGNVDDQQLLYLMARGLERQQAEQLVVNGFLRSAGNRIENEKLQKYFQKQYRY